MSLPAPFVVGAPRSGTTLLRLMLDAHPELAIGPETHFLIAVGQIRSGFKMRHRVFDTIVRHPTWVDFGIEKEAFDVALSGLEPFTVSEACRCFYKLYAGKFGKSRFGDKTPTYAKYMLEIERLVPEAHFVHLIRDGRDVALSLRPLWFSPGWDMTTLARYWVDFVESARASSKSCRHYLEIRYEDLIENTESVLRDICAFIEVPFAEDMLQYYTRAEMRLGEHQGRLLSTGRELTKTARLEQQRRTLLPPQRDLVFHWKQTMSTAEQNEFSRSAGGLLEKLGYEVG